VSSEPIPSPTTAVVNNAEGEIVDSSGDVLIISKTIMGDDVIGLKTDSEFGKFRKGDPLKTKTWQSYWPRYLNVIKLNIDHSHYFP